MAAVFAAKYIGACGGRREMSRTELEPESLSRFAMPYAALEYVSVSALRPYDRNARTHSKKQIRQIANSIARFGFTNPVLISDDGQIIAGHGRVEAAKLLQIERVPTLCLSHLSDAERRAYIPADNKLAQNAGWDREILALELQGLLDLDFEVGLAEIDMILATTIDLRALCIEAVH